MSGFHPSLTVQQVQSSLERMERRDNRKTLWQILSADGEIGVFGVLRRVAGTLWALATDKEYRGNQETVERSMKRRDLFKGIFATAVALAVKPLASLLPRRAKTQYPPGRIDVLNYEHWGKVVNKQIEFADETLGAGVLDTIHATSSNRIRTTNANVFYEGQRIEIWSAQSDVCRGKALVRGLEGNFLVTDWIPPGTVPGDLILLERFNGIQYFNTSHAGEYIGLKRS